ncbi:tRNA pseudouridine(55) synthase TruB [Jannaschia sp. R86511]|uniref:tRNA pseudouridine(55) synthase TruB n=1 Tax=Jannaschia sp. R86511 TaxID=3093853 RepID=UPI0036D2888C
MAVEAADPVGVLVVDKPAGASSHDVVARCRKLFRTRRVGHAGTLDPMATGVLVVGVGWATRLLTYMVGHDKTYLATVRLGVATVTDDAEGEVSGGADASHLVRNDVEAACGPLRGDVLQVPSSVSAIKVDGRRSYARVRSGEDVALRARPVTVHGLELLAVRPGRAAGPGGEQHGVLDVDVRAEVSSGTYVRALARDLGVALGVGGHLTELRRTRSGPFEQAEAFDVPGRRVGDDVLDAARLAVAPHLLDLSAVARRCFEVREVDAATATLLGHGRRLPAWGTGPAPVAAIDPDGRLVALVADVEGQARGVLVVPPELRPPAG